MKNIYMRRRRLRVLERGAAWLEKGINRLSTVNPRIRPYNPLYHLGTLAIFLLIVLTVTGLYLTIFYRPGVERAYVSVAGISATWLGSLMRTVHRYASDGLIVVTLLHALKMVFSDRFWGSRWLAWLSGWSMVILFWVIGLMGYWLVWDEGAQWLTTYFVDLFQGPLAFTFYGADLSAATYSLFVIVLFLHVFLPVLLVIGVVIHVLRLTRARYWAPRWLMVATMAVLVIVSLWRPVQMAAPADLSRLVDVVSLDWWYLGFLPVAEQVGSGVFWTTAVFLLLAVTAVPWLFAGRHDGPAEVIPAACTGCGACARECPFEAIEMVQRDDETEYSSLAVVTPDLCTGCGICVGACPDKAIELDRLPSAVVREDLQRTLGRTQTAVEGAVTVFTCERHAALGTLPPLADAQPVDAITHGEVIPLLQAKQPPRVNVGTWADSQGERRPIMTCVVPCTGMLHPNWAAETIAAGGKGAIVVSCPAGDCAYREGPHWIANRLQRRRTLRKGNVHFLELAPGSRRPVTSLWGQMIGDEEEAAAAQQAMTVVGLPKTAVPDPSPLTKARHLVAGLVILLLAFGLSWVVQQPGTAVQPTDGQIRLVINHGGQIIAASDDLSAEILEKLPENVDPAQVLGGERFPVRLRLAVDGETVLAETYQPRGLRREGSIYGMETWWTDPGEHQVTVWLMDDGAAWRVVFDEPVIVPENGVARLLFDEGSGEFVLE